MDKRTPDQLDFDLAKHGWSFCNDDILRSKIHRCEQIAQKLNPFDKRHHTLEQMKAARNF